MSVEREKQSLTCAVLIFIGSVIVGPRWFRILPGTLVGAVGIVYAILEYIPSIEPPANMRYVTCYSSQLAYPDANFSQ